MAAEQLNLFSGGFVSPPERAESIGWAPIDPSRLSDTELIAALPGASQREVEGLTLEAVRRGLPNAVPALEALCRRFSGFGLDREVIEQTAALSGLAALGGAVAAQAVTRLIVAGAVRGPGQRAALEAACTLGCGLPPELLTVWLRDDDPRVREAACRCARAGPAVMAALVDLLTDLRPPVTHAAALALGRLGRPEARAVLLRLLATAPSAAVIQALAGIADDDDWVRLGQTALRVPELAGVVLEALEESEAPRAVAVAAGVRRRLEASVQSA
jgi:hypothetical protein